MSCDPYEAERRGRDAARYHQDYTMEHTDIMRKAEWDSDPFSCERHYADAYERELRHQEEMREEARREEEDQERRAYEHRQQRLAEEAEYEHYYYDGPEEPNEEPNDDPGDGTSAAPTIQQPEDDDLPF